MNKKYDDINDLVTFIVGIAVQPLLDDEIWQCYGYKKRPRKGNIWTKMFPKKFQLENLITRELLTMGLVDVLNGIKKSKKTSDNQLLISMGIVDQYLSITKHMFDADNIMDNLFTVYTSYLNSDKSNLHKPIILKAKKDLNKKDFAKFMVGTIKLLAIEKHDDYLLNSDYIKDVVNKSSFNNKLEISISGAMYKKYETLMYENIINTQLD